MQDTASMNLHLRLFPPVTCSLSPNRLALPLSDGTMADKTIWGKCRRRNILDRKPCPHDNDGQGTSFTAARKHGFPFFSCAALYSFPVARCAIPHTSSFSFPPLQVYAIVPMPPFQTASVVISVTGAKVKTGLGTQIF